MAVREIKTRLSIDGEQQFKRAISDAQREMRTLNSEMKVAKAEFDRTGDAETLLKNKTSILNAQIKQQTQIVQALEKAVDDAASAYGTADRRTDGYRIQLNNARAALVKLETQLDDTNREMTDMGRDARKIGRQIESGLGDAADDTRKKLEDMYDAIGRDIGDIRGSVQISAAIDIAQGVADAASGVAGMVQDVIGGAFSLADESLEQRQREAYLRFNARANGYTDEQVESLRIQAAAVTGDQDAAIEGISNLTQTSIGFEGVQAATDALLAASTIYQQTMQFENLAESTLASLKSGNLTGQIEELLFERLGIDEEPFRAEFEAASTEGARNLLLMEQLQQAGLMQQYAAMQLDPDIARVMQERAAQQNFETQKNRAGELAGELVAVPAKNAGAAAIGAGVDFVEDVRDKGIIGGIASQTWQGLQSLGGMLGDAAAGADDFLTGGAGAKAIENIEQNIEKSEGAQEFLGTVEKIGEKGGGILDALGGAWSKYAAKVEEKGLFPAMAENYGIIFDKFMEVTGEWGRQIADTITDEMEVAKATTEDKGILGSFVDYQKLAVEKVGETLGKVGDWVTGLFGGEEDAQAEGESIGSAAMDGLTSGIEAGEMDAVSSASIAGISASQAMAQGIADGTPAAVGAAANMADGIIAEFNRVSAASAALTLPTGGTATGGGGTINVNLNADGRNIAKVTAPYLNTMLVN